MSWIGWAGSPGTATGPPRAVRRTQWFRPSRGSCSLAPLVRASVTMARPTKDVPPRTRIRAAPEPTGWLGRRA
jgi:hypothetical protein